jgi:site-specific DNA-cytosine methylase
MRWDLEKEMETFDFPSQDKMIEELQAKNLGYDFQKGKHTITKKTSLPKLKQYYIADKLSCNLGDISLVEKLPYTDLVTYSFPCTDLSVAGKGEGMVNKCDTCGHSWPIDFSNAEEILMCPECGAAVSSSTRSGLLGQVQRLLAVAKENDTLPKYLLLENVKNLIGKKFIGQFEAWVKWLDSIGYNTHYKVLNGKHYGIPQNRERVFAISIRKDIDTKGFTFPETIPLTTRLKDMLEKNVDEKYYLPDDRIEKILNSTFMQEKKRIQTTDVCDTLLARDWKDPKCVPVEEDTSPIRIGNIYDENYGTGYAGNVWDTDGVSPTLQTAQGGNRMPLVLDEIKVVGNYMPSNHDASRVVDIDGIAPTVKENHGTVTAIAEPFIVASRGRNPDNPSDRTIGAPTEQRLEPNFSGCTNTLTSVQKDNYVAEPIIYDDYNSRISADQDVINTLICNCGASAERNGVKIIEPIVCEERRDEGIRLFKDDCVGTLRTIDACGDKRVLEPELMIEDIVFPVMIRKYPVDIEKLKATLKAHKCYSNKEIAEKLNKPLTLIEHWFRQDEYFAIPDADMWLELRTLLNITTDEFDESIMTFETKDGVYDKSNRCYHAEGISPTLTAASANEKILELQSDNIKWRIRKLTPKCCWRLMGFTDEDHDRAAKYTSASARYKQAGNSIITSCLIALMSSLFIEDGHKAEVWTKYTLNYSD